MKLPSLFSNHMVLQQGRPVRIWGWAEAGESITVSIAGQTAQTVTDADGAWSVMLNPLTAGGPFELLITGAETIVFSDVLVGEVWVCSGQSNMEMGVEMAQNSEEEIANANYPLIRLFTVPKLVKTEPQTDVDAEWLTCTPENIVNGVWGGFSAAAYYFGRKLVQELNVPIGLIHSSWGGTVAEAWTSRESLLAVDELRSMITDLDYALDHHDELFAEYKQKLQEVQYNYLPQDAGNSGLQRGWADPTTDTADWAEMDLPGTWQSKGLKISGVFWFRKTVSIPEEWAGQDLKLHIGACDKDDWTYFNGEQVGSLTRADREDSWSTVREYSVPGRLVKAGNNTIAVRVFSDMYDGGMRGPANQMYLAAPNLPNAVLIPLTGIWQYMIEQNFGFIQSPALPPMPMGEGNPNSPTGLYNAMLAPLVNFTIRGAIWYQGESNASRAEQYRTLFPTMIRDWRTHWGQGDFPFLFVQLANYIPGGNEKDRWAELREAQLLTLQEPNTGMAVIADVGDANDIHPTNKQEVGRRLALNALAKVYGCDLVYSGPIFRSVEVEGNAMRLHFDHVAEGLCAHGPLTSFIIAGEDNQFVPAEARIDGDTVLVSNSQVTTPVAVRYAWEDNPECTLYNSAGLPASPFRTDMPVLAPVG